jgi:hypothetical protein
MLASISFSICGFALAVDLCTVASIVSIVVLHLLQFCPVFKNSVQSLDRSKYSEYYGAVRMVQQHASKL